MEALSIRAESGEGLLTSGKPKHRENSADRDALAGSGSGPWKMRTSRPIFDREEAVAGACRKVRLQAGRSRSGTSGRFVDGTTCAD